MARKYTSKDIKSMIDKHTEILESLENSFSQPAIYGNKIQTCINNMFSSGVFASDVKRQFYVLRFNPAGQA